MASKKALLKKCGLCVIADKETCGDTVKLLRKIKASKGDPAFLFQLRDKRKDKLGEMLREARKLKTLAGKNTLFIINDHPDIAMAAKADGVHLGQEDLPLGAARKLLGKSKIIGISCHNLKEALRAQKEGADYIGIGPVLPTPTKPENTAIGTEVLKKLSKSLRIPFFAIGGIDETNLNKILAAGAKRAAVCRAVCSSKNVPAAFMRLNERLK
ncbi:MAG: thiamine phosphate synthase [Candidatus Omnitrophica bacterium]|nr:thiamine phosphate synthase [Candidatus Omnitrophota bacterium]MDD5655321.1 thiamine phosphate synthase [Candidatus Omnitrophota bacterium]